MYPVQAVLDGGQRCHYPGVVGDAAVSLVLSNRCRAVHLQYSVVRDVQYSAVQCSAVQFSAVRCIFFYLGHIEVAPHEDPLLLDGQVGEGQLVQVHGHGGGL